VLVLYLVNADKAPVAKRIAPAAAVRQADNSLLLQRQPVAHAGKPPAALPRGGVEERRIQVKLAPKQKDCAPLQLDMSLLRDADGGRRIVASSPDGTVVDGVDMVIKPDLVPAPARRWHVGMAYQPHGYGLTVQRDVGRLQIGAMALKPANRPIEAWATVGVSF
jgi:hypothetical protein